MFRIGQFLQDTDNQITEQDIYYQNDYPDRIFSNLLCYDYDWMYYILVFVIPVANKKDAQDDEWLVFGRFVYSGTVESDLDLQQGEDRINFRFDADIFKKHIKEYMQAHIDAWDDTYAFNGEKQILDFINDVVKHHMSVTTGDECRFKDIKLHEQ